jgi:membrane protein implicated in regulation of membrane protease activity
MKNKKIVSFVIAVAATIVGVATVVDPVVPVAWKGLVTALVSVLNYLTISPVVKLLGASEGQQ